ncbi:MAG: alpha-galactosidase, partial [Anaerolineae bacterium]|nr:alpha-galactosidase [Anaerolineae bacterium]
EISTFADFAAIEWVLYLRNTGRADSAIIEDIQPLDVALPLAKDQPCRVHHALGSECHYGGMAAIVSEVQYSNFAPQETALGPGQGLNLSSIGGRSSHGSLPFFNLECGDGGVIGAVGWTGDWAASLARADDGVCLRAGMKRTHLRLRPGEEIRTPRILLLFWQGDRLRSHNLLRRFILAHHTPRSNGEIVRVPASDLVWGERRCEEQIAKARWLHDNRLNVDCFWVDAGWYGDAPYNPGASVADSSWFTSVGNWWPNRETYPDGLAPLGEAVRAMGFGFVLWVEPERVYAGTALAREHPEWLFGPIDDEYILNLGLPEARRHVTERVSRLIEEGGVTWYRQDFNIAPAPFWQAADAEDRVGMSEIRHIEGLYAFWDELLARHPGLMIDNCAAGGRRIDLETISRSVPLWRSDVQEAPDFDPAALQTQTHGLSLWVPLSGGYCRGVDTCAFRSALSAGVGVDWSTRAVEGKEALDLPLARRLLAEYHAVRPYFYGDYHPLSSFSTSRQAWSVWQFDRPDLGEGMVLALRRPESPFGRFEAALRGLEPEARYEWRNVDTGDSAVTSGRDLLEKGVRIDIAERPGSALLLYRRVD